jgi:hypothetical protein
MAGALSKQQASLVKAAVSLGRSSDFAAKAAYNLANEFKNFPKSRVD